jgi:AraC-like DNA-binding protein
MEGNMNFASVKLPDKISVDRIFTVYHLKLVSGAVSDEDFHDFPEIIYMKEGKNRIYIDDKPFDISAGEMIIYAPKSRHQIRECNDSSAYIISFGADFDDLHLIYNKVIRLDRSQKLLISQIAEDGVRSFVRPDDEKTRGMVERDDVNDFLLQRMKKQMELFLISVYNDEAINKKCAKKSLNKNKDAEDFAAVVTFLEEHIRETLSLSDIAERCSVSISRLKALFGENSDKSPISYFIDLKIKEAKRLITDSSLNFTEISERLSFNSLHYFSRLFKERVGMTPSQYAASVSRTKKSI